MRTVKEQAAAARAAGLKNLFAIVLAKTAMFLRRADAEGTCRTCKYLRNSPRVSRSPLRKLILRPSERRGEIKRLHPRSRRRGRHYRLRQGGGGSTGMKKSLVRLKRRRL
jgi:hypothetical protein